MESVTCSASHVPHGRHAVQHQNVGMRAQYQTIQRTLEKALRGERISFNEGVALFHTPDLVELGAVADALNQKKNGLDVFFNVNRHINPTNICALSCKFCAFSRKPGDDGAYAYSEDEIAHRARVAADSGATEVHMVGGLHPRWKLENYKNIIKTVKTTAPHLHVKAFTAVELDWLARKERKSVHDVLCELRDSGLGSLPGGGAEIFAPYVREKICDTKLTGEGWLNIHRTAHQMGLRSNCTMLYGHIEDVQARVDHMMKLRALQDETQGFNVFIPLAFQPENNELGIERHTYGVDDLKTIAVARILLDNFKHIKSYWVMTGERVAQTALHYGANDLDGTVVEEKIANMAGSRAGMAMAKSRILRVIRDAGRVPVERSTVYEPIRRYDNPAEDQL